MALFKSPQFLEYVNDKAYGGVRMNFKYEFLEDWEIPFAAHRNSDRDIDTYNTAKVSD